MISPDEVPMWFAIPASVVLCLVWRRQVIAARTHTNHENGSER